MTDGVWVAFETAVRAGLVDAAVLENPPKTEDELTWLVDTVTDHVCGTLPQAVYQAFRSYLEEGG